MTIWRTSKCAYMQTRATMLYFKITFIVVGTTKDHYSRIYSKKKKHLKCCFYIELLISYVSKFHEIESVCEKVRTLQKLLVLVESFCHEKTFLRTFSIFFFNLRFTCAKNQKNIWTSITEFIIAKWYFS